MKEKTFEAAEKIRELESRSDWLFGTFKYKGKFIFDENKVPKYDIPDLNGFQLKPYVSYKANKKLDENLNA